MRKLITLLSKKCFSWLYAHRAFRHCDAYALPRVSMWMSAVDAIGFCLLSAVLTFPVWVAAYLLEASSFLAFTVAFVTLGVAVAERQHKVVAVLLAELVVDIALIQLNVYSVGFMVSTAFVLTFYRVGKLVYGFFFQCVDYRLSVTLSCKSCGTCIYHRAFPNQER